MHRSLLLVLAYQSTFRQAFAFQLPKSRNIIKVEEHALHSLRSRFDTEDERMLWSNSEDLISSSSGSRRAALRNIGSVCAAVLSSSAASSDPFNHIAAAATTPTGANDGNLVDLPPETVRSYLQYRVPLQIAADFYVFDLQGMLRNIDDWGEVGQLFQVNNNRGQGQPSRIERDYVNPMRIIGLSMPPDVADDMRESQFKFEKAMAKITKVTAGIRRDLPVEIDPKAVPTAVMAWDEGRVALNDFFQLLNGATGLKEMRTIPAAGPNQAEEYGRSSKRYYNLVKKTKLCQNRGGPALSQAWGQLMVSGYLQDSCGIPDLNDYFYQ